YNDTIRYFLTWDAAAVPKRYRPYSNTDYEAQAPSPWGWHRSVKAYKTIFWAGLLEPWLQQQGIGTSLSAMLESEGFGGLPLFVNAPNAPNIEHGAVVPTPSAYQGPGAPEAFVEATTAAQNNAGNGFWLNHHTQWYLGSSATGPLLLDTVFNGARTVRGRFYLPAASLGPTTTIAFRAPYDLNDPGNPMHVGNYVPDYLDWQALSNVMIRYARTFNAVGAGPLEWEVPPGSGPLLRVDLTGFAGTPVVHVEGDSLRRVLPTLEGGAWKCIFPRAPGSQDTKVRVFAQEGVQAVTALRPATPSGYFTDFAAQQADSAMLIVTHGSLMNGALAYAAYRESSQTNRYQTLVADVDELYDQYGGGIPKHAYAIRAFSRHMLQALPTP
ncbi:MAG: C25 family cysteine peptidase, partial [Flavobacteriales bacterium]